MNGYYIINVFIFSSQQKDTLLNNGGIAGNREITKQKYQKLTSIEVSSSTHIGVLCNVMIISL